MFDQLIRGLKDCFKRVEPRDHFRVVEPPEPPEPTILKEQIEIEVEGSYKFKVKPNGTYNRHELSVNYDVVVSFGLHMIPLKSSFKMERKGVSSHAGYYPWEMTEEQAYEIILEILKGDVGELKEQFEQSIKNKLNEALSEKELEELKKQVKLNKSYEISMSFKVDKSERYK